MKLNKNSSVYYFCNGEWGWGRAWGVGVHWCNDLSICSREVTKIEQVQTRVEEGFKVWSFYDNVKTECLVILGTLGMSGYAHLKRYYHLVENFCLSGWQKINFVSHAFLEKLQRYQNFLFWVLWVCMATQTQNDSINFQKTSMSICMPKMNFTIHFCLEILHSKESSNLIGL